MTKFETIQYVMTEGGQDRPAYSNRFQPIPVYYLVEMTWPFNDIAVHPIALPIFIFGLAGLGVVCLPPKKTRHLLPNMVPCNLCFLYVDF